MSTNTIVKAQKTVFNDAVRGLVDSSAFTGLQGRIGASAISVDEGASLNFTVVTGNDATYYYWVEGVSGTVDSADFTSGWADSASRGTFSITNGIGTFSLTLASDATTDGTETFRVKVSRTSSGTEFAQSATVTINDTSLGPSQAQGSNFGYTSGGLGPTVPNSNVIDKFPFASDANATSVGALSIARDRGLAGQSSSTHGYASGGTVMPFSTINQSDIIDKFSFTTEGTATDIANLTLAREYVAGQSSTTHGYTSGGSPTPGSSNVIDKFPFSADIDATDVGDLTSNKYGVAGISSTSHGYAAGGYFPSTADIEKFSFAVDQNSSIIGTLTLSRYQLAGQNSNTHGYASGGFVPFRNTIDKFPFASDADATDVGDLTVAKFNVTGQSSTENGYNSGGSANGSPITNVIEKFPFASDANASDVGDLSIGRYGSAGQQY